MSKHEERPWLGLDYYERFGVPGYPPPRRAAPISDELHAKRVRAGQMAQVALRALREQAWEDVT